MQTPNLNATLRRNARLIAASRSVSVARGAGEARQQGECREGEQDLLAGEEHRAGGLRAVAAPEPEGGLFDDGLAEADVQRLHDVPVRGDVRVSGLPSRRSIRAASSSVGSSQVATSTVALPCRPAAS